MNKFKGFKPLFYNENNQLVLSKANNVFLCQNEKLIHILTLPVSNKHKILMRFKKIRRLLRLDVQAAIYYDGFYYFCFVKKLFKYNLKTGELLLEHVFANGRGPLSFSVIEGVEGFDNGLYFGEYIGNREKNRVSILKKEALDWVEVYQFPDGCINHVHNIVPDTFRNCIWVLTGDFGSAAAIFQSKDNFNFVTPVLRGDQNYRTCVAFPLEGSIIYATDSQLKQNSIRLLKESNGILESVFLAEINGSCIYGAETKDFFVFSTSTEPTFIESPNLLSLLDNKPATSIKANRSDLLIVNKNTLEITKVLSSEKDCLPYRLFQFGTIMFPAGVAMDNKLAVYNVGSKKNDLDTLIIDLDEFI